MTFKDVAHFYLGVEVQTKIRLQTSSGKPLEIAKGRLVCIDLFYEDSVDVLLDAENDMTHYVKLRLHEFKPLLRSLEDMTEEEKSEIGNVLGKNLSILMYSQMAKITDFLTSRSYDVFGLIESGQAIRKAK